MGLNVSSNLCNRDCVSALLRSKYNSVQIRTSKIHRQNTFRLSAIWSRGAVEGLYNQAWANTLQFSDLKVGPRLTTDTMKFHCPRRIRRQHGYFLPPNCHARKGVGWPIFRILLDALAILIVCMPSVRILNRKLYNEIFFIYIRKQ